MRSFTKDISNSAFSKFAVILLTFFKGVIIARYLGPEKNGLIAAIMVYPTIVISIGSLGIRQANAFFIGSEKYSQKIVQACSLKLWGLSSVISLIGCYILTTYFLEGEYRLWYIIIVLAQIPFSLFNTYQSGIFLGQNNILKFNKITWLSSLVTFLVTLLLVVVFPLDITGALIALVIGHLIVFLMLIKEVDSVLLTLIKRVDTKVIVDFLKVGMLYAFSLLLINLNYKIDIIFLNKMSDDFNTGIYSKGVLLVEYLWQIPMLFGSVIFARRTISKDQLSFSKQVAMILRVSLAVVTLVSVFLMLFSDFIVNLIFGSAYYESSDVIKILLPGVIIMTCFKILYMDIAGMGKQKIGIYVMLPALVINIVLNYFFIPEYGADGAAIASTISYSFSGFAFLIIYKMHIGLKYSTLVIMKRSDIQKIKQKFLK